jgi:hypothetical protein
MGRPQSIIGFERCFLGGIAVGLINSAMSWSAIQSQLDRTPGADLLPGGFMIGTIAVGLIINLLLWYFAARRRAVVAKWIIVAFFGLGLLGIVRVVFSGIVAPTMNVFAVVGLILQAIAVWMLFRPDAKAWFAGRRDDDLTQTFS